MKKIEKVDMPATTRTVVVAMVCDLCGMKAECDDRWEGDSQFHVSQTRVTSVMRSQTTIISLETGSCFPDGADIKGVAFDICPTCFSDKLIPWMASQGATPRKEEKDW